MDTNATGDEMGDDGGDRVAAAATWIAFSVVSMSEGADEEEDGETGASGAEVDEDEVEAEVELDVLMTGRAGSWTAFAGAVGLRVAGRGGLGVAGVECGVKNDKCRETRW